ncbi:MAG: cupredoxin domain-containing protein [Nitrospira sp.]|nr:cupredoxin domain-containing protein [Nitrospira sp.]
MPIVFSRFLKFFIILLMVGGGIRPDGPGDVSWASSPAPPNSDLSDTAEENSVTLTIKSRVFIPETISLPMGQKTHLTIINHDSELHAFVPIGLLTHTHINLSGNGAPQFGKEGLLRVLLPTRGQTDIVFIPTRPGNYPFFCDLPGHVMRGNIVVQEKKGMVE